MMVNSSSSRSGSCDADGNKESFSSPLQLAEVFAEAMDLLDDDDDFAYTPDNNENHNRIFRPLYRQTQQQQQQQQVFRGPVRRLALWNTLFFLGLAFTTATTTTATSQKMYSTVAEAPTSSTTSSSTTPPTDTILRTNFEEELSAVPIIDVDEQELDIQHHDDIMDDDPDFIQDFVQEECSQEEEEEETGEKNTNKDTCKDLLIVSTVDGTMAGICQATGEILWKQSAIPSKKNPETNYGNNSRRTRSSSSIDMKLRTDIHSRYSTNHNDGEDSNGKMIKEREKSRLLQPLVSTTTTTTTTPKSPPSSSPSSSSASSSSSSRSDSSSKVLKAVPSTDGMVHITFPMIKDSPANRRSQSSSSSGKGGGSGNAIFDYTFSEKVREIVSRTPFVDTGNRFYVGSRHSTMVAIDGNTGEILDAVSADNNNNNNKQQQDLHGKNNNNIIWIGRVDYSVTVYDARTGIQDVQFSTSEIMSVNDMLAGSGVGTGGVSATAVVDPGNAFIQHPANLEIENPPFENEDDEYYDPLKITPPPSIQGTKPTKKRSSPSQPVVLATPNGNVAYVTENDFGLQGIEWIANETFDTPVAFAIESSTGCSLGVNIIPDVPLPQSESMEYLSKEMHKQMILQSNYFNDNKNNAGNDVDNNEDDDNCHQPALVVGSLFNGQLYALPLGSSTSSGSTGNSQRGSSSPSLMTQPVSMLPSTQQHQMHSNALAVVSNINYRTASGGPSSSSPLIHSRQHTMSSTSGGGGGSKSHHVSSSSSSHSGSTPGCHFFCNKRHLHQRVAGELVPQHPAANTATSTHADSSLPSPSEDHALSVHYQSDFNYRPSYPATGENEHGHFHKHPNHNGHSEYGFSNRNHNRTHRRILRILGSWLPPTIALIFVVSFELGRRKRELGRRKRQKDIQMKGGDPNSFSDVVAFNKENLIMRGEITNNYLRKDVFIEGGVGSGRVIQVTDQVLGYGGHGTVVYRGTLEGRKVAVKRMLKAYHASADREISLLIESDGHPNVVRYFLKEVHGDFVYLALELCDISLHDLIGILRNYQQGNDGAENSSASETKADVEHCTSEATKKIILQIANGVKHLHSLRIVHRDLKPANILLALSKQKSSNLLAADDEERNESTVYERFTRGDYVAKISDMGLGKQLVGQSSYGGSTLGAAEVSSRGQTNGGSSTMVGVGPGSVGWQAPEVMAMRWASDASVKSDASNGNNGVQESGGDQSPIILDAAATSTNSSRTSRSVDIFSLGCIFYSTLVPGTHPFGEWYEREANIMHNRPCIDALKELSVEAYDLVSSMIHRNPNFRPTGKQICEHPFFWKPQQRLSFLCGLSDRLETDAVMKDDNTQSAISSMATNSFVINPLAMESNAVHVVGVAWDTALYTELVNNVQRFRTYDPSSVRDLLRLIRNKHHHYEELPVEVRVRIGTNTEGLMNYFDSCFPKLLLHCYKICSALLPRDDPLVEKYSISPATSPKRTTNSRQTLPSTGVSSSATFSNNVQPSITNDVSSQSNTVVESSSSSVFKPIEVIKDLEPLQSINSDDLCSKDQDDEKVSETVNEIRDSTNEQEKADCLETDTIDIEKKDDVINETMTAASSTQDNDIDPILPSLATEAPASFTEEPAAATTALANPTDILIWEGSSAAKTFNCRGWIRSDDEWIRGRTSHNYKKQPRNHANLIRCATDGKFRTRLCNHWDVSEGTSCPMRKKNKCVFAHGPVELRVKEGKKQRWGKLVDKNGNNSNPKHSGGEDTYGAARSIETVRKEEGKWNTSNGNNNSGVKQQQQRPKKNNANKKKKAT